MFAGFGLAGLEPGEKPTGSIFIVLVFVHQIFEVVSKHAALKIREEKEREAEAHCLLKVGELCNSGEETDIPFRWRSQKVTMKTSR